MHHAVANDELRRASAHPSNQSIYNPKQPGLLFPTIPTFATFAEERQHRKERLVAACRAFALHELDYGFAGHLTVRDPEFPELYWTNPMAVHFSQVKLSNLILAAHAGKVVEGKHALNRAGFVLQAAVHDKQQMLVEATGITPHRVPDESARYSREHVGSEYIGWLHFQPIYDQLLQTCPDMFA